MNVGLFNAAAATVIYTLSLHDALPIWGLAIPLGVWAAVRQHTWVDRVLSFGAFVWLSVPEVLSGLNDSTRSDRKSTRLNSSHRCISYAVFCLKKKKTTYTCMSDSTMAT